MNTAFNRQHHLNMQCVVLCRDSIYTVVYALCQSDQKNGKPVNVQA